MRGSHSSRSACRNGKRIAKALGLGIAGEYGDESQRARTNRRTPPLVTWRCLHQADTNIGVRRTKYYRRRVCASSHKQVLRVCPMMEESANLALKLKPMLRFECASADSMVSSWAQPMAMCAERHARIIGTLHRHTAVTSGVRG